MHPSKSLGLFPLQSPHEESDHSSNRDCAEQRAPEAQCGILSSITAGGLTAFNAIGFSCIVACGSVSATWRAWCGINDRDAAIEHDLDGALRLDVSDQDLILSVECGDLLEWREEVVSACRD
jgi:hypothetical protein